MRSQRNCNISVDKRRRSCMISRVNRTITVDEDVYKLLSSLKRGEGDSFSEVLRRHIHKPARAARELLAAHATAPSPNLDPLFLSQLLRERSQHSHPAPRAVGRSRRFAE